MKYKMMYSGCKMGRRGRCYFYYRFRGSVIFLAAFSCLCFLGGKVAGQSYKVTVTVSPVTLTDAGGIRVTSTSCGEVVLASTGEASVSCGGVRYEWYEGSTKVGASAANGGTLTGVSAGSHIYKRRAIATSNTSSSMEVSQTVTVGVQPAAPLATSVSRCGSGTVMLSASGESGVVVDWYAVSSGGSSLFSGISYTTPSLSASTTYYVEARNTTTGCVSASRTPVTATVAIPSITSAGTINVVGGTCGEVYLNSTSTASANCGSISYEWYEGSTKVGASAANGGTLTGVSAGSHTYKRKAIASGNTSSYLEVSQVVTVTSCGPTDGDGNTYPTVVIGSQTWMGENLNDSKKGGECYDGNNANCATYGRLYTWDEAMAACPAGWHLPSDDEWKTLEMALGMTQADADKEGFRDSGDVGIKLKEGGSSGMNLLLGGRGYGGSYYDLGSNGFYWTSTEGGSGAWMRYVYSSQAGVTRDWNFKASRYSVRCVKDK